MRATLQTVQAQLESKFIAPLDYNSFYLSIGDILSNHWDPLGIFDSHWPHNKYEGYIPAIYNHALSTQSTDELVEYLSVLAFNELGVEENLENDKRTSVLILAVRDYYFRNII
jgi:hypothetical protein